ncbi:abortive infection family protein [Stenotrophomonas maltophilia]|nr:abortive infection family protein [Stenotrophomonas maltophilia]
MLEVPAGAFAPLRPKQMELQRVIENAVQASIPPEAQDYYSVHLTPVLEPGFNWREEPTEGLSRTVRRNILDGLRMEQVNVFGVLPDPEFLSRIFELRRLPSTDSRFKDAAGDIYQHRINNDDWDQYWVFDDDRFALLDGPADTFLRFLCEIVHPVVRPDRAETEKIVQHFNDQLRRAGWELVEEERIAGRPRYVPQQLNHGGREAIEQAKAVADFLEAGAMARQIERMQNAITADPEVAIGAAKDFVESCCKTILGRLGVDLGKSSDINDLTKRVAKELELVPEDVSDRAKGADNIRLILRNLTAMTNHLAELRGRYGTGHGPRGNHRGLQPRHARLAVNAALAYVWFVTDTYQARSAVKNGAESNDNQKGRE